MKAEDYILGYIFKGKLYESLTDIPRGVSINEDNKPKPFYNPSYVEALCLVQKAYVEQKLEILKILMSEAKYSIQ